MVVRVQIADVWGNVILNLESVVLDGQCRAIDHNEPVVPAACRLLLGDDLFSNRHLSVKKTVRCATGDRNRDVPGRDRLAERIQVHRG